MPFYTKPLSQLDTADLQELLNEQAVENVRLEFKLNEPDKDGTLKKLTSFGNTFGGYMLIGAKADSKDGRLQDLPGVAPIPGYKQKVVDWCFAGASPPLAVEVSDPISVPGRNANVCYAIYVPESDVAPHFLNGRRGVWVRTDEFSARFDEQSSLGPAPID
jgi:predicted HTH transcriptional regulator